MTSESIERFREHSVYPNHPSKEGEYVRYLDHQRIVKELEELIAAADELHVVTVQARVEAEHKCSRLRKLIDTPHTDDWLRAVPLEAAHQIKRWGVEHDVGKSPLDWFWLIGYLAQKAATSAIAGDTEKAKHHTVSTGAVLLNWFRRLTGDETTFQPGVDPTQRGAEAALSPSIRGESQ